MCAACRWWFGRFAWALVVLGGVGRAAAQVSLEQALGEVRTVGDLERVLGWWESGGGMGRHSANWDRGQTLSDLSAIFDRDTASFDYDQQVTNGGVSVSAVDTERFGGDVAIYGAPTLESVAGLAGSYRPYAAGLDSGGLPVVVSNYRGNPTLTVYRGGASPSVLHAKTLLGGANKPTTNYGDILSGEADEEADYCHDPRGAVVYNGLIVLNCCTFKYSGAGSRTASSSYAIDGVSCVFSTDNGATWELAWRSGNIVIDAAAPPTDFGSEWAINGFNIERDGSADDLWITVTSYASGNYPTNKRSADSFLFHATGGAGAWSLSNAIRFNHPQGSGNVAHAHLALVFADPAHSGGLKYLAEVGDNTTDNRTEEWLCSSASGFLTGASAMTGATNVVEGGSNWTGPTQINGKTGAGAANEWMSSQTISYAPGPSGGWYGGADEGASSPIFYASVPATDGARVNWEHAYGFGGSMFGGTSGANPNEVNWRCFTANAWDYSAANPAVAAFVSPGSNWPTGYHDCGRIFYKPSGGDVFGVVYAPQDEESMGSQLRPVLCPDGYIYIGTSNAHGLRRFLAPTGARSVVQAPVFAGPGAVNVALATIVQQNAPGAGNTVTIGATPPSTAPFSGSCLHFVVGTTSAGIGTWRITGDAVSKTHSRLTVDLWVLTPTDAAAVDADTYWRARFYSVEGGATGTFATLYRGPNRMEVRGHWTLLRYELKNGAGADDDWNLSGATDSDGLKILMQMQMAGATVHPGEWYMGVAGVYVDADAPPSYVVPPATTGDTETLSVDWASSGSEWTAYAAGVLGATMGRDCRHHTAGTFREVLTLWEGATKYVELAWDAQDQLRLRATNGASTATATLTGLPKFLRGDPLLLGISYDGAQYSYAISAAGTVVATGTIVPAGADVLPTQALLSQNHDGSVMDACRWALITVDDSRAASASELSEFVGSGAAPALPVTPSGGRRSRSRERGR